MKKIIIILILITGVSSILAASNDNPSIVIADFKRLDVSEAKATILLENIINHIVKLNKYKVVERERLQKILSEQNLSGSDLMDRTTALKIGKLLSAQKIIVGTAIGDEGYIHINARLISVESGEILKSSSIKVKKSVDLDVYVQKLVYQLFGIREEEITPTRVFNINFAFGSGSLGSAGGEWNFHKYMSMGLKVGFSAYRAEDTEPWSYNLPVYIQFTGYLFDKTKSIRPFLSLSLGFTIALNKKSDSLIFGLAMLGCEFNLSRIFSLFGEVGMIYRNALLFQFGAGIKIFWEQE